MLRNVMLWLFIGSIAGLLLIGLRQRYGLRWLGALALNVGAAGILLYFIDLAEPYTHFQLPINAATMGTVAVLGVPGLAALVGLKLLVVG